jgi:hypothetical protein
MKPSLQISYVAWAGHVADASQRWCAVLSATGVVWDYGTLAHLTSEARRHRLSYEVLRCHRNGKTSVVASWHPYAKRSLKKPMLTASLSALLLAAALLCLSLAAYVLKRL